MQTDRRSVSEYDQAQRGVDGFGLGFCPEDRPCPADFVLVEIVVFAFQVALQDLSPYR